MEDIKGNGHNDPDKVSRNRTFDHFLQFLMTFLGVSLGFFADNLREQWSDQRAEVAYLVSLQDDLRQDTAKLNFSISRKAEKALRMDTLIRLLSGSALREEGGRIHLLLRLATIREPFYVTEGTLRQLENAGGFRILQNRKLVGMINDYRSACAKVAEIQAIRDDQSTQLKLAISRVADGKVLHSLQDFSRNPGDQYWLSLPKGDPALLSQDAVAVNELIYWVSNENSLEGILQRLHMELKTKAIDLMAVLSEELADK